MRFKLIVEYDGGRSRAGSVRKSGPTVQGALEKAVFAFTGETVDVVGAGRTESGVHANGQVAHFDIAKLFAPGRVRDALNAHLRPAPISVISVEEATPEFHARFDAIGRVYWYRILNRRSPPALERGHVWHVMRDLDRDAMAQAAEHLIGKHDFTTFRDANCQAKSPVKTLDSLEVMRAGEEIHVWAKARSFLHRQVRSMVGDASRSWDGKRAPDDVAAALAARDRARCGPVAPADGLYLERVNYPLS